jgi:ribosomal-protein-alanine N-acetyltransferase
MDFTFRPMDRASAQEILAWCYDEPYDLYDLGTGDVAQTLQVLLDPQYAYYIIEDGEAAVAYCCFGLDAQVPGGDYSQPAVDVGLGVRPDLTGQRQGSVFVEAVLDFARRTLSPERFRVTIAAFNARARRVWAKVGFQQTQVFRRRTDGMDFVVMVRQE